MLNNTVLASQTLVNRAHWNSQALPSVSQLGDRLQVAWAMGGVPVTVRFSADGGVSWLTLAIDSRSDSLVIDPTLLPQNGVGLYQITPGNSATPNSFQIEYDFPIEPARRTAALAAAPADAVRPPWAARSAPMA